MSDNLSDLVPEFGPPTTRSPLQILRELAATFPQRTKGLVHAEVETEQYGERLMHSFRAVIPQLNDYTFELFRVSHAPIRDDSQITGSVVSGTISANSEREFVDAMRIIFSSAVMREAIDRLMAQVADYPQEQPGCVSA